MRTHLKALIASVMLASVMPFAAFADEPNPGPFAGITGTWSGGGNVIQNSGEREQIKCRAVYRNTQNTLHMQLRCAAASFSIDATCDVTAFGNRLAGRWVERTHDVSGDLSGTVKNNVISVRLSTDMFTGDLFVTTNGNRQTVVLRPHNTETSHVTVNLAK